MAIEVFNRHEKKYMIDVDIFSKIQMRLTDYMELDAYNKNNAYYTIANLYYDTADIEESNRLASLVNNILELSILQSNNEALQIKNVNLSETLKKILHRFGALSKLEGFEIKANIDYDLYVLVDEQRMERVIYNLIGNAINYIGEDKEIKVNLIDLGSRVRFEVIDTGKGIPSEELNLIWDRYYKAKTHKRSIISNGLGLSIVKSILEMHQAEFGIESAVGKGSKFWFELRK